MLLTVLRPFKSGLHCFSDRNSYIIFFRNVFDLLKIINVLFIILCNSNALQNPTDCRLYSGHLKCCHTMSSIYKHGLYLYLEVFSIVIL